ncbi:hypothetical protein CRE_26532 [Caenorhabditis remanei]|uniref:Phosphatidic acid phosphatase type 2/haloperoxidase domain-containing protein n=1 Tax=Caenorhabditis remanei TaxID=31234 RepID=E3LR35_CAERE|nr:hypothetical protein CRE_26532 [Caenorhabditis remanei]
MEVFRRTGAVVNINMPIAITNVVLLYGFFFIIDYAIKVRGITQRGFFCVDPSIHYTKKSSTVSSLEHRIYNISLMVLSVIIVEALRQFRKTNRSSDLTYRIGTTKIPKYLVAVLTFIGYSQVGYIVNELLVKFVKGFIGRLRPNFFAVCDPLPIKQCEIFDPNTYVDEYFCQGVEDDVEEARKSFYSGHSTVTMYCAFWTVLYLQARLKPALRNNVIVAILQTLIMAGGLFICCSRISDNKHHSSDVFVGIVVGMSLASISVSLIV